MLLCNLRLNLRKKQFKVITIMTCTLSLWIGLTSISAKAQSPNIEYREPEIQDVERFSYSTYMTHGGPRCPNYYTHALAPSVGVTDAKDDVLMLFYVDNKSRSEQPQSLIGIQLELWPKDAQLEPLSYYYKSSLSIPTERLPAIIGFRIPQAIIAQLEPDESSYWEFYLICDRLEDIEIIDPRSSSGIDIIGGFIYRKDPGELMAELTRARPLKQVELYAKNGFWYPALSKLAQLRRGMPNDDLLDYAWHSLLVSAGFDEERWESKLVNAPIWW